MRSVRPLARGWKFKRGDAPEWILPEFAAEGWTEVTLPSTNLELPLNGFDETSYQFISTWLLDFELEPSAPGRRVFVDFEAVMTKAEVFVNGRPAGQHWGGYTPFSIEITEYARDGVNRLALRVDSRELPEVPPFGHVVDYLSFGGIYREVFLRTQDSAFISSIFAKPFDAPEAEKRLDIEVAADGLPEAPGSRFHIRAELLTAAPVKREGAPNLATASVAIENKLTTLSMSRIAGLRLWSPSEPALYDLIVTLERDGIAIDRISTRVGWRSAEWRPEGFFLNGERLKIRGLNRHQSFPYLGYAMPERAQRRDAEILKRELGVNMVRTSHYPQSRHFLDACDELGLLVFEEIPGWQHIGDRPWQDRSLADLRSMIERDRNHPSIVLWGVRINESRDDGDFYTRTNELARSLDPTRQTGGVRAIAGSEFLEDVYTYNDFVHSGRNRAIQRPRSVTRLTRDVPYLITEHNGHMFPTKRFDNEERLAEQALRHARVLDAAYGDSRVAGAIGWCAFDYNTHKDFGSGDRVCYHGVCDMFRIPKYAACVYASQVEPSERVVLEAASLFAKGERQGAFMLPVQVWTNCDELVLFRSKIRIGSYFPDRASFPYLPHPPVLIRDLVGERLSGEGFSKRDEALIRKIIGIVFSKGLDALGWLLRVRMGIFLARKRMSLADGEALVGRYAMGWGEKSDSYELVGYVAGKEVTRRRYGGDAYAASLEIKADYAELKADGADVTRVVVRLLDQYGNVQPYAALAVEVSIEGPGKLVGPSLLPLMGGVTACWVRSTILPGSIEVRVRSSRFPVATISLSAIP